MNDKADDVSREKAKALLWSGECENLTDDEFEVLWALARDTDDEEEEPDLSKLKQEWRRVRERSRVAPKFAEERRHPKYGWMVGLAAALMLGAFLGYGFQRDSKKGTLIAQSSVVPTEHRGVEGTGIEVASPEPGYVYVLLIGRDGSSVVEPGPSTEIFTKPEQNVVVEVEPELVRENTSEEVRAISFVTPVAGARSVIASFVDGKDLTNPSIAEAISDELLAKGHRWVAKSETVIPGE